MMINSIRLGKRVIDKFSKPYMIAEIGVNHEGSIDKAKLLIDLAKKGGADAAKFQTYKAENLASKNSPAYWDTSLEKSLNQYNLFKKFDNFNQEDYFLLSEYCKKLNIDFISTPFDYDAIDFLDSLMPFFKISSSDITNIPFLRKIAKKKKPVILSTGASNLDEINIAVDELKSNGCNELALLHCILNYPTEDNNAHLLMIKGLIKEFPDLIIGYSDHTLPDSSMTSLVSAYLLGAVIIEKHFTFNKELSGNDHYHAMDINDLRNFTLLIDKVCNLLGSEEDKHSIETELIARENARRSIVLSRNIMKGSEISEQDLTCKRPASGISPLHWDEILQKKALKNLNAEHILQWKDIDL
jgi:sialic acid synthase SpsE